MTPNLIAEQKASCSGHPKEILDPQMARYHELQLLFPGFEVRYQFFRHDFRSIKSNKGTQEELYAYLADHTYFGIELPLSILTDIWKRGKLEVHTELAYLYDGFNPVILGEDGSYDGNAEDDTSYDNKYREYQACTLIRSAICWATSTALRFCTATTWCCCSFSLSRHTVHGYRCLA